MKQITGIQVRKIREMKSISQDYVARQLGISQAAYSNIENGKTNISENRLLLIASALNVKKEAIMKFDVNVAIEACLMLEPKNEFSYPEFSKGKIKIRRRV